MFDEVAGYKVETENRTKFYCVNCAPEDKTGLEKIEEVDKIPVCDNCGQPIPAKPTEKGKKWILETFDSAEEADKVYPGVGGWWYEIALEEKESASAEPKLEIDEEEILAKMRQIDQFLEKLLKG